MGGRGVLCVLRSAFPRVVLGVKLPQCGQGFPGCTSKCFLCIHSQSKFVVFSTLQVSILEKRERGVWVQQQNHPISSRHCCCAVFFLIGVSKGPTTPLSCGRVTYVAWTSFREKVGEEGRKVEIIQPHKTRKHGRRSNMVWCW